MKSGVIQIGHSRCPNCKILKPILEKVCKDMGIEYLEIDMFTHRDILMKFTGAFNYQYQVAPTAFYVENNRIKMPPIVEGSVPTESQLVHRIERIK